MKQLNVILSALIGCIFLATGCSSPDPITSPTNTLTGNLLQISRPQTHLWGYYDVYIDLETKSVTAIPNRHIMFTANVVTFINKNPANLKFLIHKTPVEPDYIDVDIDVTITHPFPGLSQYNGYDVRGIFIGQGSETMHYNNLLAYPKFGVDQFMLNDPTDGDGGAPDGYTRWFNPTEFTVPGLFGYTPGIFATKGYFPSATLNPYKYFADGLGANTDLWEWLNANASSHGVFSAGSSNTRNYYIRFPFPTPKVKFAYAIAANWEAEDVHPSNALEAVAVSTLVTPDIYYVNETNKGGNLILDISVFNWSTVMMETQKIYIESTVLSHTYELSSSEMIPTGGTDTYSTYHVEIPADNIKGTQGNEFWVIVENPNANYKNDFGVSNAAGEDPLAAFFRYDLFVSDKPYCPDPTVLSIEPDTVMKGLSYTDVKITGTNFLPGPSLAVKLTKTGSNDIIGTNVNHVNNTTITADFDFTDAAPGLWDVVVTNGCGKEGIGTKLLEVTSCGTLQGFSTNYHAVITWTNEILGYIAGMAGTQTGTPYAIGCGIRSPYNQLGAIPVAADSGPAQYLSSPIGVGAIDRDVVCDSQNRVYFTDNTNYSRLRYTQFSDVTGFGPITDFATIPSGWSIWRITVDENDNPIILAYNSIYLTMKIFHWNGSDWNTVDVPSSIVQGSPTTVGDFEWNPAFNHYVFVKQVSSYQVDLYAINTSGTLVKTLTNIFDGAYSNALPGIYIDVKKPLCDVVCWGGFTSYTTNATPFARMTAAYSDKVVTTLVASNFTYGAVTGGRGQVAKGSNRLCVGAHYINVYAKVPLPSDW